MTNSKTVSKKRRTFRTRKSKRKVKINRRSKRKTKTNIKKKSTKRKYRKKKIMKGMGSTVVHDTHEPEEVYVGPPIEINKIQDPFYFATQKKSKKGEGLKLCIWINFKSQSSWLKFVAEKKQQMKERLPFTIPTMQTQNQTQNQIDNSYVNKLTLGDLNTHIGQQMGMSGGLFNLGATDSTFEFKHESFNVKLEDYKQENQTGILTLSTSHKYASLTCGTFKVVFHFEKTERRIYIYITKKKKDQYHHPKKKRFAITIKNNKIQEIIDDKNIKINKVRKYMEVDILTKEELKKQQEEFEKKKINTRIF